MSQIDLKTQVLDLETMQFVPGPTMRNARSGCAALSIDKERVLVIGGSYSASTEVLASMDAST